jgi:hypothetical protein
MEAPLANVRIQKYIERSGEQLAAAEPFTIEAQIMKLGRRLELLCSGVLFSAGPLAQLEDGDRVHVRLSSDQGQAVTGYFEVGAMSYQPRGQVFRRTLRALDGAF